MSLPNIKSKFSAAEFLAFERASETKHEFINGQIIDMAGGSFKHADIIRNLMIYLTLHQLDDNYRVRANDVKVHNPRTGSYYYPDVVVAAIPELVLDVHNDILINPCFIAEVTSLSTREMDRTIKKQDYELVEPLADYLIVSQYEKKVERYSKTPAGVWGEVRLYQNLSDVIDLSFSTIILAEIYKNIHL